MFILWSFFPGSSDSVESRLQKLFSEASSTILANLNFDMPDELSNVEVCLSLVYGTQSFTCFHCIYFLSVPRLTI